MIERKFFLRLVDALLVGFLITLVAGTGWLDESDWRIGDKFFQKESERNPDIIVIGIDKVTLNNLGPSLFNVLLSMPMTMISGFRSLSFWKNLSLILKSISSSQPVPATRVMSKPTNNASAKRKKNFRSVTFSFL